MAHLSINLTTPRFLEELGYVFEDTVNPIDIIVRAESLIDDYGTFHAIQGLMSESSDDPFDPELSKMTLSEYVKDNITLDLELDHTSKTFDEITKMFATIVFTMFLNKDFDDIPLQTIAKTIKPFVTISD